MGCTACQKKAKAQQLKQRALLKKRTLASGVTTKQYADRVKQLNDSK